MFNSAGTQNNNFTGTRIDTFTIAQKQLNFTDFTDFTAVADPDAYNDTGNIVTPTVEVADHHTGTELTPIMDYTATSAAIYPGTHTATIIATGNYTGEIPLSVTITGQTLPVTGMKLTVTPEKWIYTASPTVGSPLLLTQAI